ncbi:hypothetical protein [Tsukamurella pseudospumae]|uniref:hypothetical protein n=1 Tax=Tsukamurella pseudospumae TaxID=239498 RepID=UPI000AD5DCFE|nr:hypothetical protein [Tsukamurella pseudospumae]
MSDSSPSSPAAGGNDGPAGRPPRPAPTPDPLPEGAPRHARTAPAAGDTAQFPIQRPPAPPAYSPADAPSLLQQRLQGAFLTIIGLAGVFGGVLFSIEAPRFTPVPVVFLTFWLVMVIVGKILFAGLGKLREAGISAAPAPSQVRAAAAVAAIVVSVGMMGFAATSAGSGVASAAPCPGGGPATCGPTAPELTFTPPPAQTGTPGGQQGGQQGGQDQQGIATSPAGSGGDNGPGIQAQTPEFGTPGQQAPNIPGNEQPGQGNSQAGQQPAQGQQQTGQQNPVRTTAPGRPAQNQQPTDDQQPNSGQSSSPTVTVTKTESQCAVPGAGAPGSNGGGGPGAPGSEGGNSGGPDNSGSGEDEEGAPSWSYLVAEVTALMTGRRRPGSATPGAGNRPTTARDSMSPVVGRRETKNRSAGSSTESSTTRRSSSIGSLFASSAGGDDRQGIIPGSVVNEDDTIYLNPPTTTGGVGQWGPSREGGLGSYWATFQALATRINPRHSYMVPSLDRKGGLIKIDGFGYSGSRALYVEAKAGYIRALNAVLAGTAGKADQKTALSLASAFRG